jgi:hypothetical protein
MIQSLHQSGATPLLIKKFMSTQNLPSLTTSQLAKITRKPHIENFTLESDSLLQLMESLNGYAYICEEELDDISNRIAVLTFTQEEYSNIKKYGDVLFIDSTFLPLNLDWQVLPLTVVTEFKTIECAGILFAAVVTTEVIIWLFTKLCEIPEFHNSFRTLTTDDDQCFLLATNFVFPTLFDNRPDTVFHVLCALHRRQKIIKTARKFGINGDQLKAIEDLSYQLCFSPHKITAQLALNELILKSEAMNKYFEKNVIPDVIHFSRSHLSDVPCLGYNVSSLAESMNHLLKNGISVRTLSLSEFRQHCTFVLQYHRINVAHKNNNQIQTLAQYEIDGHFQVSPKIRQKLNAEIRASTEYEVVEDGEAMFTVKRASDNRASKTYSATASYCECGLQIFEGIPCRHIIAVAKSLSQSFPSDLISER